MFHVKHAIFIKRIENGRKGCYNYMQQIESEIKIMGKIIAVVNQKGGVGKTTTCINLSYALHIRNKKVLLVDCDPQGNSTSGMGGDKSTSPNIYDVIVNGVRPKDAVVKTRYGSIIPSNLNLSGALIELVGKEGREFILRDALEKIKSKYDYIIIDCPPSLELLTLNALCAADSIIIPVQCEYFALEGLTDLMNTVKTINRRLNPRLSIEGIVLTMYDSRTNLSLDVEKEIRKYFEDLVYDSVIPRNVRISEAPSHGKPVIAYDRSSKGSSAYLKLANELIKNQK